MKLICVDKEEDELFDFLTRKYGAIKAGDGMRISFSDSYRNPDPSIPSLKVVRVTVNIDIYRKNGKVFAKVMDVLDKGDMLDWFLKDASFDSKDKSKLERDVAYYLESAKKKLKEECERIEED